MSDETSPEGQTVWVVEHIEDHAAGWLLGVYSTRELAVAAAEENGGDLEVDTDIYEMTVDDGPRKW